MFPLAAPYSEIALQRYATLLNVADVVSIRQRPAELLRALVPHIRHAVPCEFVNLALHDPIRDTMNLHLWHEGEPSPCGTREIAVTDSPVGWVWKNQHALYVDNLESINGDLEESFQRGLRCLISLGLRSYCGLPLTSGQRLGALGIAGTRIKAFGVAEKEFLLRVAEMVALSLDDTQPQSALLEERERISLLAEIGSSLTRLRNAPPIELPARIAYFLEPLQKWAGPSYLGLYLYEPDTRGLRFHTPEPQLGPRLVAGSTAPLEGTVAGRAFRNRKPEILTYADLSELPFDSVKRGLGLGVKSLCMIPVLRGDEALGVLKVASRIERDFSSRDVELLTRVADTAADFVHGIPAASPMPEEIEPAQPMLQVSNGRSWHRAAVEGSHREPGRLLSFISASADDDPEELLAEYFSSSTLGLCILDDELRYLAINRALAEKNGLPAKECLGKTVDEVLGDLAAKVKPELQRVLTTGEPVLDFEVRTIPSDPAATNRWLKHYFRMKDSRGSVKQIGIAVTEITEPRKLDESVRQVTDKLQREQNRLRVFREMDIALGGNLDLKHLFAAATNSLEKAIPFDLAGIWLYEQKDQIMRTAALNSRVGEVFREGQATPLAECMLGQAMLAAELGVLNLAQIRDSPFANAKRLLEYGIESTCCVPLIATKGPLGALGLASRKDGAFSQADVDLLSHAASSIALALEIALTREALQREKDRLQVLSEISVALSRSKSDFQQTFPVISACIRKVVSYDMAILGVFDRHAGTVRSCSFHDNPKQGIFSDDVTVLFEQSIVGQLLEEREARNFTREDLEARARNLKRLRQALDEGLHALGYVPLHTPRGLVGALLLGRKTPDAFTRLDLSFLKALASELALSVESSLAHEALGREKERLQALREIDAALIANADLETALPRVSECLRKAVPHEHMGLHVYDERARVLRDHVPHSAAKSRIVPGGTLPLDASVAGQVFVEGKTRILDYEELANVPYPVAKRAIEQGVRSICFVPLIAAKGPLGVLVLSSDRDKAFREQDIEFLGQVAATLAQAGQNASAHKALREEKKRLQVLLNVSSVLTANWNVQETFATISSYLRRVLRHECAFFSLYEQKSNVFVRQAQDFPLGKGLLAAASPVFRGGPQWLAVAEQRAVIFSREDVEAFRSEAPLADWANGFLAEGLKSMCCVPLLRPKGPLGTLTLASTRPEAFGEEDATLLNQVASQLAVALENAGISREVDELNRRMAEEKRYLEGEPGGEATFEGIIGDSPALRHVLDQVATVAGSDATTLILGETGTGKELIARAIHRMSGRSARGFIKLNCAAIPTGLLESELFGHEKGAFTGAVQQKVGRLELADQGTLFLDEVGEIPLELQPKLLRVLQDHEFERLGGVRTIKVNLRLVAATNRQLSKSVASGHFRSDLFYRLNVFPIRMPPLRERRHDIPALLRHFVHKYAGQMGRHIESVPTETMQALMHYHWPGNVRELENLIERSVILSQGGTLRVPVSELAADSTSDKSGDTLENAEREHIIRVLRETKGVISGPGGAAHKLGLKRTTLQSKMQRLGISRDD